MTHDAMYDIPKKIVTIRNFATSRQNEKKKNMRDKKENAFSRTRQKIAKHLNMCLPECARMCATRRGAIATQLFACILREYIYSLHAQVFE